MYVHARSKFSRYTAALEQVPSTRYSTGNWAVQERHVSLLLLLLRVSSSTPAGWLHSNDGGGIAPSRTAQRRQPGTPYRMAVLDPGEHRVGPSCLCGRLTLFNEDTLALAGANLHAFDCQRSWHGRNRCMMDDAVAEST
ncbi:hypothetical protein CKAH01_10856 [Colletotrichum kahawae]|uniref:Uncharacterized protein n=1 Tax=Colletotrichum kahawae TaxID=34407 RepID=A0AAE0CWR1_COLKA|nr:hypothetical protein CKAH01_10856 [Colletotrichum kahawae]